MLPLEIGNEPMVINSSRRVFWLETLFASKLMRKK